VLAAGFGALTGVAVFQQAFDGKHRQCSTRYAATADQLLPYRSFGEPLGVYHPSHRAMQGIPLMHTYSPAVAVIIIITAALIWLNAKRDGLSILQKQFAARSDPGGPYTECEVRFPTAEVSTPCLARTTAEGWYMFSPQEKIASWRLLNNVRFLRTPVFISWSQLVYGPAKFPMQNWVRFDVSSTKAIFFVRRDVAVTLLQAVGKSLPPG
jgi:hypothetical protein